MTDEVFKQFLLTWIMLGVWALVLIEFFGWNGTPSHVAEAQRYIEAIDTNLARIAHGTCANNRLC